MEKVKTPETIVLDHAANDRSVGTLDPLYHAQRLVQFGAFA